MWKELYKAMRRFVTVIVSCVIPDTKIESLTVLLVLPYW